MISNLNDMNSFEPLASLGKPLTHQDVYDLRKRIESLDAPSFDAQVFSTGLEISAFYIRSGYMKFLDFAHKMMDDVGGCVRPFIKCFYSSMRYCPGLESFRDGMSSPEFVDRVDVGSIKHDNKYYRSNWKTAFGIWYASEFIGKDCNSLEALTERMVKDFGESIRPEVPACYRQAREWFKYTEGKE